MQGKLWVFVGLNKRWQYMKESLFPGQTNAADCVAKRKERGLKILAGNAQQFLHTLSKSFTLSCLLWLPCLKTSLTLTCQRATSSSKPSLSSHAEAVPGSCSPFYSVFYLDVWYHPSNLSRCSVLFFSVLRTDIVTLILPTIQVFWSAFFLHQSLLVFHFVFLSISWKLYFFKMKSVFHLVWVRRLFFKLFI